MSVHPSFGEHPVLARVSEADARERLGEIAKGRPVHEGEPEDVARVELREARQVRAYTRP